MDKICSSSSSGGGGSSSSSSSSSIGSHSIRSSVGDSISNRRYCIISGGSSGGSNVEL